MTHDHEWIDNETMIHVLKVNESELSVIMAALYNYLGEIEVNIDRAKVYAPDCVDSMQKSVDELNAILYNL